ncbi:hypothetical protein ACQPZ2_04870 [Nocardia pseudovaccinii]|uniref:hypothetical protein n=1 Tax=Nocardia pseudovaccinii TaxID=189540 RepID=UPI003D91786E
MTSRFGSVTTITGASPAVISLLRRAAQVAEQHGRNALAPEDLQVALLQGIPWSTLEVWWPRVGGKPLQRGAINDFDPSAPQQALTYTELVELVASMVPGPAGRDELNPAEPVAVTYELSGPDAREFRAQIDGSE